MDFEQNRNQIVSLGEPMKKWNAGRSHALRHMGIKNRTLLWVSGLITVALLIFIVVFILIFNQKVKEDNADYSHRLMTNMITSLDIYIDEVNAIANESNYNYYLQNYLFREKDNEEGYSDLTNVRSMQDYEMSAKLFNYSMNSRSDISSIMIFGNKSLLLYKSIYSYLSVVKDYSQYPWYQLAQENESKPIITGPQTHEFLVGNTEPTISLSRTIQSYEDGSFLGVILIDLNLNKIEEICGSVNANNDMNLCILNNQGELVYEENDVSASNYSFSDASVLGDFQSAMQKAGGQNFTIDLGGKEYQVVSKSMAKTDWTILALTPLSNVNQSMYQILITIILVVAAVLLITIISLNTILKRVVKPIIDLKNYMDLADKGNLTVGVDIQSTDETGLLAKSFNRMLGRIDGLMKQVVSEQEEKRKYELQALQAQINPHFLYNTLDSIIWMAEMKNPDVVPMTEALAKLFRISLNKGNELISITDEFEHVRNYLVIQSMRYKNKFDYTLSIADEVRYCKTIKLIIQPVVENSIYHGIKEMKEKGRIIIAAFRDEDSLVITITDNGIGMEENICDSILKKESQGAKNGGSGIAVKNVNERIKLHFGDKYGLSYVSTKDKGTIATLLLPIIENIIE